MPAALTPAKIRKASLQGDVATLSIRLFETVRTSQSRTPAGSARNRASWQHRDAPWITQRSVCQSLVELRLFLSGLGKISVYGVLHRFCQAAAPRR